MVILINKITFLPFHHQLPGYRYRTREAAWLELGLSLGNFQWAFSAYKSLFSREADWSKLSVLDFQKDLKKETPGFLLKMKILKDFKDFLESLEISVTFPAIPLKLPQILHLPKSLAASALLHLSFQSLREPKQRDLGVFFRCKCTEICISSTPVFP